MNEESVLKCNMFKPGAEIISTPTIKNGMIPVGSVGFFSHYAFQKMNLGEDFCRGIAVISRKGKQGKARVEATVLTFPTYSIDVEQYKNLAYPEDKPIKAVYLENCTPPRVNVLNYNDISFLCWVLAQVLYLKSLSESTHYSFWSKSKDHPLNVALNVRQDFEGNENFFMQALCEPNKRVQILDHLRAAESQLVSAGSNYMYTLFNYRKIQAANLLAFVKNQNMNYVKLITEECDRLGGMD